ncbi:MAG: alanyl-tRNA editing protein [Candidatus Thorarchaeota archaeon]|nr:MAG: alanyl-tRNA editing protein [Candidatus Thorarchaeota archaeon]
MTELLHMRDNYLKEFDATVSSVGEGYVVLDRTAFYPEGGGQSGDKGELWSAGSKVLVKNVAKQEGTIRHLLMDDHDFKTGDPIRGVIDWDWRYECMRFHTAQHVLSRYLQLEYGLETVGNHIKPGGSRADYAPLDELNDQMKTNIENGVNDVLSRSLDVEIRFMPRADAIEFLQAAGYQTRYLEMVPKSIKEFRVMVIGDYDASSCAGTHVSNTSEIGSIVLGRTKNVGAGKRRIYFKLSNKGSR